MAEELSLRRDDESGPSGGFMHCVVSKPMSEKFLQNTTEVMLYVIAAPSMKASVPRHGYFNKLSSFLEDHCRIGKYFLSFQTQKCINTGNPCNMCASRTVARYPNFLQPVPDYDQLPDHHYFPYAAMKEDQGRRVSAPY